MSVAASLPELDQPRFSSASSRVPELDGLRGLAIAGVMANHCALPCLQPQFHTGLWRVMVWPFTYGWAGVDLFFVLSGFLITSILLDTKNSPRFFTNFYARRTLRIFPVYYLFLMLTMVSFRLFPAMQAAFPDDYRYLDIHWIYLQNWIPALVRKPALTDTKIFSHFWSLAIEEQFYLSWPLLVYLCSERTLRRLCVFIPVMALAIRIAVAVKDPGLTGERFMYYATFTHIDGLAMGAWSALILRSGIAKEKIMQMASFAAIAALAIFVIVIDRNPLTPFWGNTPMAVIGLTAAGLGFTSLLLHALYAPFDSGMRGMLRKRWLQFLGKYSYAIYIVHMPVIIMTDRLLAGRTGIYYVAPFLLSVLSISIGLSLISWRMIEKPCLSLKDRFTT